MKRFKKKIMGLLLLIYVITAGLVLLLLNVSYFQNNKSSISRILNMKFQIASSQDENGEQVIPKGLEENKDLKVETGKTPGEKEDSSIKNSYLAAKAENGTLYVKNMLTDQNASKEQILETAENILATGKNSGSYQNYQFEITVHEGELLIDFADITSVRLEEEKYLVLSLLVALALGLLWIYPAWRITGRMVAPLEEADRLQKEFVMFAGHELKTPITVMKASLDMMEKEGICSKYLNYAMDENEKMRSGILSLEKR